MDSIEKFEVTMYTTITGLKYRVVRDYLVKIGEDENSE